MTSQRHSNLPLLFTIAKEPWSLPPDFDSQTFVENVPLSDILTYMAFEMAQDGMSYSVVQYFCREADKRRRREALQPLLDQGTHEEASDGHIWRVPKSTRPRCGAKCRTGLPCQAAVGVYPNGDFKSRCALHGGKSTGPQTPEGRAAIAQSNRRRAAKKREATQDTQSSTPGV